MIGSIFVDTDEANNSLQKTDENAEKTGKKMTSMGDKVTKAAFAFNNIVSAGKTVLNALVSVYNAATDVISNLDEVDKGSQRMQVSAEYYQELAYASELCGISMSTMEKASKKLEGTDLTIEDALQSILSLETAEERTAKASELFGDAVAYEMTPLLNVGANGFDAMRQEANDLGLVMSGDMVTAGADANDALTKVNKVLDSAFNDVLVEMLPYITTFCNWLVENLPGIIDTVVEGIKWVIDKVKSLIDWCKNAWEWLQKIDTSGQGEGVANAQNAYARNFVDAYPDYGNFYADGGIITTAQHAVVGESGPEMIVPLDPSSTSPYAVSNLFGGSNEILSAILAKLDTLQIVLDSGVIAGAVNSTLAKTKLLEVRGA